MTRERLKVKYKKINQTSTSKDKQNVHCCRGRRLKFIIIMAATLVLALSLTAVIVFTAEGYPIHASCKISWQLPSVSCQEFASKITAQAKAWETADNCNNGGEKCLYKITKQTPTEISGTHETPVKHYVDDISFTMTTSGSGCSVKGSSRSETWYAYLDYSTNYCNLENLITGSGLNATTGFSESTSDDVCTQYSSRNCEKY